MSAFESLTTRTKSELLAAVILTLHHEKQKRSGPVHNISLSARYFPRGCGSDSQNGYPPSSSCFSTRSRYPHRSSATGVFRGGLGQRSLPTNIPQDGRSYRRTSASNVFEGEPSQFTTTGDFHTADQSTPSHPKSQVLHEFQSSQPPASRKKKVSFNLVDASPDLPEYRMLAQHKGGRKLRPRLRSSQPTRKMALQPKIMRFSALKALQLIDLQIEEPEESQNSHKKRKSKRRVLVAVDHRQVKRESGADIGEPMDGVDSQLYEGGVDSGQSGTQGSPIVVEQVENHEKYVDSEQPVESISSQCCEDDVSMDTMTSPSTFQPPQQRKVSQYLITCSLDRQVRIFFQFNIADKSSLLTKWRHWLSVSPEGKDRPGSGSQSEL